MINNDINFTIRFQIFAMLSVPLPFFSKSVIIANINNELTIGLVTFYEVTHCPFHLKMFR